MQVVSELKTIIPNERQKECIETLTGPVMVLAGPGTGKTFTIIQRIKYMLSQGINPEKILALAFSEPAANEMKMRLVKEVGTLAATVEISTYHAFCNNIIIQFPLTFELIENFEIIDELLQYHLMQEAIDEYKPQHLVTEKLDPYFYINPLITAVSEIKKNRITKEQYFETLKNNPEWTPALSDLLTDKKVQEENEKLGKRNRLKTVLKEIDKLKEQINKAEEAWGIIARYIIKMKKLNLIDFDDMINLVLDVFESDPQFLEQIRSKYDYLLVDEYQDTNKSQNELIFNLAGEGENTNIFVVGDDDQIIYQFQGAQTDNLERFLEKYPTAKVICLQDNNRSTQVILDFAKEILKQTPIRLETNPKFEKYSISKMLTATNKEVIEKAKKVQIHSFGDPIHEHNFIADQIQELIQNNKTLNLSEIAVIVRTNKEIETFADLLKNKGIPFQSNKKKDIFQLTPSLLIYLYLKALENHKLHGAALFGMLNHPPFNFHIDDYSYLVKENTLSHKDFITILREKIDDPDWKEKEKIDHFLTIFEELKRIQSQESLYNLIIHLVNKTEILNYYVNNKEGFFENIVSIKRIADEARNFQKQAKVSNLQDFLNHLGTALREGISIEISDNNLIRDAVQLITAHKAKGREFEYVFLANLNVKNWEKKNTPTQNLKLPIEKPIFAEDPDIAKDAEIGRLLFVACTRAKHTLILTHSNMVNGKNVELTKFVSHLSENDALVERNIYEMSHETLANEIINGFSLPAIYTHNNFKTDLEELAKSHIMSPSSLRLYTECPRKFLYSYLYKIPTIEITNTNLSFGSAMHSAIEKFTRIALQTGLYPTKEDLIQYFNEALKNESYPTIKEKEIHQQRGIGVLDSYYVRLTDIPIDHVMGVEMNISNIPLNNYWIKGKIDRIEKSNGHYTVIDFKTGSNKSKTSIEAGENTSLLDQLIFYKLLYEQEFQGENVNKGVLIFVEEPKTLDFDLTQEHTEGLKEKILTTFEQIHKLNFNPVDQEKQEKEACKFCDYKLICKLNVV